MSLAKWKIISSRKVIAAAFNKYQPKLAIAWAGGKDSTVMLHMIRDLHGGTVPVPVMFIDTGFTMVETLAFVGKIERDWNLNLIRVSDRATLRKYKKEKNRMKKKKLFYLMKIRAIKRAVKQYRWKALLVGIRWDEHRAHDSEVYFSARKNHIRIHPLLQFSEDDIWNYTNMYEIPRNDLYAMGYRSVGELDRRKPSRKLEKNDQAEAEKEVNIRIKLRSEGYF